MPRLIVTWSAKTRIYGYSVSYIFVLYVLLALLSYNMKPVLLVVFELLCWEAVNALCYICMQSHGD